MAKKTLYFLCFIVGSFLALTVFYIEYKILSQMMHFEEPTYIIPQYNIKLSGMAAAFAHFANIGFGLLATIIAVDAFKKFRK